MVEIKKQTHGGRREKISDAKRQEIIIALREDPKAYRIAMQRGDISYWAVRKIAEEEFIDLDGYTKPGRPPMSETVREEIIGALRINPNAAQIARQRGDVSGMTVIRVAKQAGIELCAGARLKHRNDRQEIIADLKKNPNATQTAKQRGYVSVGTVWRIAKEEGIKLVSGRPKKKKRKLKRSCQVRRCKKALSELKPKLTVLY